MGIYPGYQYSFIEDYGPVLAGTYVYCIGVENDYVFFHLRQTLFGASQLKLKLCKDLYSALKCLSL